MNPMKTVEIADGVVFNTIHDNRFKTMKLIANIYLPMKKETAASNALLCYLLVRCCKKYPDFTTLSRKLGSLYGAMLDGSVSKVGDMQCLTISVGGIDDKYALGDESVSEQLGELFCEVIFHPKVEDRRFDEEDMKQEKRQLFDMIDSEFNDKRTYALIQLMKNMCSDEVYGLRRYGSKEDIEALTTEDIYTSWLRMLSDAHFEFTFVGSSDPQKAVDVIHNSFKEIKRTPITLNNEVVRTVEAQKDVEEEMDVAQSKLEIGFRTGVAEPDSETVATRLMCAILGGTASSKLFLNVREKKSLCYYCMSRYFRLKGIMIVESGVENTNLEAAKSAILGEIEELKKGNITDFEINSAKLAIVNSFRSIVDTDTGLASWYSSQLMDSSVDTPEQAAEKINAVTKDEIVAAANKLSLDTIFTLKSR